MKLLFLALLQALCFSCTTLPVFADTPAKATFDHEHTDLTEVLKSVVKVEGAIAKVDYKNLQRKPVIFNKYLKTISRVSNSEFQTFTEQQQIAFLINAYNAFTLKLIVDNYPVKSIKKIGGLLKSPWKISFIPLLGKNVNLDDIEHNMLRKNYKEARVHFAVNCASIGCPALRAEAYTATKLNTQLDEQAKLFLRDTTRNSIDLANKKLVLSKIFDWFSDDFEKASGSVQSFVAPFMTDDPETQKLLKANAFGVSYSDYDWNLNQI